MEEEKAVVGDKRFGDEESNLLDRFERMWLEAHLNQAMQSRSLSLSEAEPAARLELVNVATEGKQRRRRGPAFCRVFNKLINPILLGMNLKSKGSTRQVPDLKRHPLSLKVFSRSLHL